MRLVLLCAAVLSLAAAGQAMASKIADAETAFAEEREADAVKLYGEAIVETAADPALQASAYFGRGEIYATSGRGDLAIADFTAALALKQDDAARANTLFSRAEAENRRRTYQAAIDDYGEALKLAPKMVGAHFGRGRAYRALNMPEAAVKEYDAELKISPGSFRTLSARADILGLPQPEDLHMQERIARTQQR
jgi:tetratricopeptide (TPR) repeat protein